MAIEKGLYAAPQGIEALDEMNAAGPEIEIEIENPESVTIGLDGEPILEFTVEEAEEEFSKNLAEDMDEGELQGIASELVSDYEDDVSSRRDWMQTYVDGLELLGLKIEERT